MSSKQLSDGRWSHTFRQSFLSDFTMCAEKARASYMEETESEHTDATARGTAVHAAIEYALYEKRDQVRVATVAEMVDVCHHELDMIGAWKTNKMSANLVYSSAVRMCEAWLRDFEPLVTPWRIEETFDLLLYQGKHREIRLSGTPDCVDEHGLTWDWKTSGRPFERWEKQRWAVQPTVYTWAHFKENQGPIYQETLSETEDLPRTPFRYAILLHDGSTQRLDVWRDQTHVEWLKQQCSQIAWMIETGLDPWPLNDAGWHCSEMWCQKWDTCKGAQMLPEWKEAA